MVVRQLVKRPSQVNCGQNQSTRDPMSRASGKTAHGEENSLFKRREPHLMILTSSGQPWVEFRVSGCGFCST
ncbi:hypothetical protein Hanom_Chr02g00119261 [Helianthus anomalus]